MKRSRYVVKAPGHDGRSTLFYNLRNGLGFKVSSDHVRSFEELARIEGLAGPLERHGFVQQEGETEEVLADYQRLRERPLFHLVIMPHQNCNFRCVYCYEKFDKNKMHPDVEAGLARLVEERMRSGRYRALSVSWFGGEPLLAPDVIERLSARFQQVCAEVGLPYVATLTSNGYFLTEENVEMLLRSTSQRMQITIDGTQENHDRQRVRKGGQPTYERILGNLKRMAESDADFRVILRMNVGPENLRDAEAHIAEMKRLFGNDKRFKLYFHNIGHWGGENDEHVDVCSEQVALQLTHLTLDQGMTANPVREWIRPNYTCYAASPESFVVGADGMVYKCTVALYDERNHVGQLHRDGTLELSQEKMEMWTLAGVQDPTCRQCFFAPACQGDSCPMGRIEHGRRPCPEVKGQVREIVTLMERQEGRFVELDVLLSGQVGT